MLKIATIAHCRSYTISHHMNNCIDFLLFIMDVLIFYIFIFLQRENAWFYHSRMCFNSFSPPPPSPPPVASVESQASALMIIQTIYLIYVFTVSCVSRYSLLCQFKGNSIDTWYLRTITCSLILGHCFCDRETGNTQVAFQRNLELQCSLSMLLIYNLLHYT